MCKAAEITKNQMTLMCEDEGKAVPTVIKKRNAQGSKSKSLRNLKTPSGKAKTSTELKKKKKPQGGSNDNQANSIQREVGWGDREPVPRAEPQFGPALELTPMWCSGKESACQRRRHKRRGRVRSLGWDYPLEEEMATRSSILAWRIPWTEEPGGLQSIGWQRGGQD